jgi:hypothetical protein
MIEIDQEGCRNLATAPSREWLETNGVGAFSFSTITGLNTRRYHGLLTAATKPPVGRLVLLSKFEETLIIDSRRYELSANQYPGVIHPEGFKYQTGFRLDPFPVFTYEVEGVRLEKRVFMVQGENTTGCAIRSRRPSRQHRIEVGAYGAADGVRQKLTDKERDEETGYGSFLGTTIHGKVGSPAVWRFVPFDCVFDGEDVSCNAAFGTQSQGNCIQARPDRDSILSAAD